MCRLLYFIFMVHLSANAQDAGDPSRRIIDFPARFFETLNKRAAIIEEKLIAGSGKALCGIRKKERKLRQKMMRVDTALAAQLFGDINDRYRRLLSERTRPERYAGSSDTLKTVLRFLAENSGLLPAGQVTADKIRVVFKSVNDLDYRIDQAMEVKKYLRGRLQFLKDQLNRFGLLKEFQRYERQVYYFSELVNSYKEMLCDPAVPVQKAIKLLRQLPVFQDFFRNNAVLASLFRLPEKYDGTVSSAGLQTRNSVQSLIQDRIAAAGPGAMAILQQNVKAAQLQLGKLRENLHELAGAGNDESLPDFKPNNQKTKSFLQRLEYGTNLQSQRSSNFFPTTTDLGLSVGYKLNDKSVIGLGASYKVGWGRDIRNINVTNQGVGFRSFADYKMKGSFFASGGFEYNYQQPFSSISEVKDLDSWQQSGLVGVSKIISLKSKPFKKTKMQLLWDFLSYQQRPQTQTLKFRVGYNF